MKKLLLFMLITVFSFGLLSCRSNKDSNYDGTIVVGLECNYAPFNWAETKETESNVPINGKSNLYAEGYDIQIAKRIAEDLNYKLVIEMIDWDGLIPALESNKIDLIIAGMSPTEERKQTINFTDAYYQSDHVLVLKKTSSYVQATTFADLSGAKVMGQKSTIYDELAKQISEKNQDAIYQTPLDSVSDILISMDSNATDITVLEKPVAEGIIAAHPEYTYISLVTPFDVATEDIVVSIGVRKSDVTLLTKVNESLSKISEFERNDLMSRAVEMQTGTAEKMTIITIVTEYATLFLQGIGITLLLAIVGTIAGLLIALIFGYIRVQTIHPYDSKFTKIFKKTINFIVKIYVTVFRGTPMILQAFIFYYGFLHLGINWSALAAGIFTVSLNTGAYLTEVIRGGIGSVDKGQLEAARALGMSETKAMLLIIYPQALKNSMASIGNELIVNIKDTAVLSTIGIIDLFNATTTITGATYLYLEAYSIGAIIYLILTYTSSKLLMYFEKRVGAPVKEITSSN